MVEDILKRIEEKMKKAVEATQREFTSLRTGRATPALLERIKVECYGQVMLLNQLSIISSPEPRALVVQPWDKSIIGEIEKAIIKSDLCLTPINLGSVLKISIPPLTEERRKELVKIVKKEAEQGRVAIRNTRREGNEEVKKLEKASDISEDESRHSREKVQEITDKYIDEIDKILKVKEEEIMEV